MTEILRAAIFHTPANPFANPKALIALDDGGLAIEAGRVVQCGDFAAVSAAHPGASVRDWRGGVILPGFIDTHIHYPQVRILGGLGHSLLDWLEELALPEEARFADLSYAITVANEFVNALAAHGTTTALVFGSHFAPATAALFSAAEAKGLRIFSGLVLADRGLRPELHQTCEAAYRDCQELIARFHGKGRLGYAVIPRFALSASEQMLEACGALLRETNGLRFTTHINENSLEIEEVAKLFPWADDYLGVYERFGLIGPASVLAHNVIADNAVLKRLASHAASVAHCPCSNAALGSGVFPLKRHHEHSVRIALGTDVGGGTGFGMLKEALQACLQQRLAVDPVTLNPGQMLYLATRAGAEALGIDSKTGDFETGKAADLVYVRPRPASVLSAVLAHAESPEHKLSALFTTAGSDSIGEVRVDGETVFGDN
ncbi:MAG TPA: guanine deaminase [Bryobacteraceae bacterium]|nr:guanine deaminase [Bryobacteraceae bacterium]